MLHTLLASCLVLAQLPAAPERIAILDKAIAARDRLGLSYRLKLTIVSDQDDPATGKSKGASRCSLAVWVKNNLVRTDYTHLVNPEDSRQIGVRHIRCRNCERSGWVLSTGTGIAGQRMMVTFVKAEQFSAGDPWRIDWRRLGQLPTLLGAYIQMTPDAALRLYKQTGHDPVERIVRDGHECLVIRASLEGAINNTWFRPDLGMNPVLSEGETPDSQMKQTTSITYAKYGTVDVWFPKTVLVDHSSKTAGESTSYREQIIVDDAELNADIPDSVFTLAGLGLEDGQPISYPGTKPGTEPIWRNSKIDKTTSLGQETAKAMSQALTAPPVPDIAPPSDRPLYLAGAALLAIAGVATFVVARRRSRQS